jgi:hypothetical protein
MTGTFYINESDNRVINKTITAVKSDVSIIYKDTVDKKNPILECAYDADLLTSNYIYLDDYYYYITDMKYSQQRLILYCHADLLMSYKDDILASSCIIARAEDDDFWNAYLKDERLPVEARQKVETKVFPYGFDTTDYLVLLVNGK